MKKSISAQDIILYKKGVGAGINLPAVPIPDHAQDKEQFKSTIEIVASNGITMNLAIFVEVVPESATTVGKKIPRHLHGFVEGDFEEASLLNATYEIGDLISHEGFSLAGVV